MAFSFLELEIFTFLYYANEESDDVIGGSTKTVQHSITKISRNIKAVFFKLGTRNVNHKKKRMTPSKKLPRQYSWPQSLFVEKQISPFPTLISGTEGLTPNTRGSHIVLPAPLDCWEWMILV